MLVCVYFSKKYMLCTHMRVPIEYQQNLVFCYNVCQQCMSGIEKGKNGKHLMKK